MSTCEKCGQDLRNMETVQVQLRDGARRHASLCIDCWDASFPGDWLNLAEGVEVQRLYWPCDLCNEVCRYDGVKVMVNATHPPPRTEFLVCEDCERRAQGALLPKARAEPV